ncbi:MAG: hypothetical protein I3J02_02865 [Prevotella sp.]|nr:hypothetical protein [Prevotella sp.]
MITYTQTKIAQSRWSLSFTAVYAVLVYFAAGLVTRELWIQLLLMGVSALLMVELNNANSLIRIYSRMVSCSFLVMTTMATFLIPSIDAAVIQTSIIGFYIYFFKAYQDQTASGWIFAAFFALGIISIPFVQVLFFVPVLWILMATNVLAFSGKTFFASVLGLIGPYWFVAAYYISIGNMGWIPYHFMELTHIEPAFNFTIIDTPRLITAVFILLLALLGSIHFLFYSYLDKIRTRMMYEILITLDVCCFAFILLQPQHFDKLMAMSIVTTAPLIGHYLALSHTKFSNIFFLLILFIALVITAFNLWMPSLIF